MKDIQLPLRTAYYDLINALGLSMYENDAVPEDASTPYIIYSDADSNEDSNKSDFGHKARVLLDIVTSFPKNAIGGSKGADFIASQVLELINSKTDFIVNEDLQSVSVRLVQDKKLNAVSETERVFRRLLRFEHIIKQLN